MGGTQLSAVPAPGQGQGVREPLQLPSSCPARTPINPVEACGRAPRAAGLAGREQTPAEEPAQGPGAAPAGRPLS